MIVVALQVDTSRLLGSYQPPPGSAFGTFYACSIQFLLASNVASSRPDCKQHLLTVYPGQAHTNAAPKSTNACNPVAGCRENSTSTARCQFVPEQSLS